MNIIPFDSSPKRFVPEQAANDRPTAVLLVCIYNKNSTLITHDIIYKAFSEYGEILKILIFEKSKIWKIFVEMSSIDSANFAKNELNNCKILEDGSKMNVYFSNLEKLHFQNSNSGGIDYQYLRAKSQALKKPNICFEDDPQNEFYKWKPEETLKLTIFSTRREKFKGNRHFSSLSTKNLIKTLIISAKPQNYTANPSKTELFLHSSAEPCEQPKLFIKKLDFEDFRLSKNSSNSELFSQYEAGLPYEQLKNLQKQSVLELIEQDIQESTKKSIKNSINAIEEIIKSKQKINSLPTKKASENSFATPFYEDFIQENRETKKTFGKNCEKSLTSPPFLRNYGNIPKKFAFNAHLNNSVKNCEENEQEITADFDPASYVNPQFIKENKKSKVLYVRGIENESINLRIIYNLFSNYGNIWKMILIPTKSTCLIEYENLQNATDAKDHLNNIKICGNSIRIFYSNYPEIVVKEQEKQVGEVFIGTEDSFRFKSNKSLVINPPSCVLHVSNLKKEICTMENIMNIFSPFGNIENMKLLSMENGKFMALIRFSSIEESVHALVSLHGVEVSGRKLQISFTKSKI